MPRGRRAAKLPLFVSEGHATYGAQFIIEDRAAEHETPCTALLPLAQAALLPLVRHQADIVQLVTKHYQWSLLVDKVCDLEQQYQQMIAEAENRFRVLIDEDNKAWSVWGPMMNEKDCYGRDMYGGIEERDAIISGGACRNHCHDVAVKLYVLKQDVVKCQKFEHPDTARSVRKTEGAKMAHRLKKLLLSIEGSLKTWLRNYTRFNDW